MPITAEWVDWLRGLFGRAKADAILAKGKRGQGGAYFAEIGPDGVFREFGSTYSGRKAVARNGKVEWVRGANS